jgi:hydroxymethylpyrimidine pyrophosphatase-like HAD family hydrolase
MSEGTRIRALFFDLDGTLLTSAKSLAPSTVVALEECVAAGIGVYVATARPPTIERQMDLPPRQMALLTRGGVFLNGALVRIGGRSEYRFLPAAIVRAVIDVALERPEVNVALQRSGDRHAFRYPLPGDTWRLWGMRGLRDPDFVSFPGPGEAPDDVAKVVLFDSMDANARRLDLRGMMTALEGLVGGQARLYLTDGGSLIQAMSPEVGKRSGVEIAARMAGVARDQVAVFGDDVNDRDMLAGFPRSVAMGNADPETRACAAHVTRGNDEDGIGWALREILKVIR